MDGIYMKQAGHHFKIAFLTSEPAHDKHKHSGSLYYMGKALEQHCGEVTYFHITSYEKRILGRIMREVAKRRLVNWQIAYKRLLFVAKKEAKMTAQRLAGRHFDVI